MTSEVCKVEKIEFYHRYKDAFNHSHELRFKKGNKNLVILLDDQKLEDWPLEYIIDEINEGLKEHIMDKTDRFIRDVKDLCIKRNIICRESIDGMNFIIDFKFYSIYGKCLKFSMTIGDIETKLYNDSIYEICEKIDELLESDTPK